MIVVSIVYADGSQAHNRFKNDVDALNFVRKEFRHSPVLVLSVNLTNCEA